MLWKQSKLKTRHDDADGHSLGTTFEYVPFLAMVPWTDFVLIMCAMLRLLIVYICTRIMYYFEVIYFFRLLPRTIIQY
jgi:hypothetical protein